ncbi:MAG TPA: hypothetical protein VJM83_05755, partial [Nitrospirota bacterium]|nr:hypothetical protein [Nitrospirota bacterium]
MRLLRLFLLALSAVVVLAAGGCAKKQAVTEGGLETQRPMAVEPSREAPLDKGAEGERMAKEAPPGQQELAEPVEPAREVKALRDIRFDFDRYDIRPEDAKILEGNAAWIKNNPGLLVTVEGHCDERGTVEY